MSSSFLGEHSNFKSLEDTTPDRRAANAPRCLQDLDKQVDTRRKSLTEDEYEAASSELIRKDYTNLEFPRTMRLQVDPPLNGQLYGLYSFIPAKGAKPDLQGCFGTIKLRGAFPTEAEADRWAESIIRGHDSYATIDYTWIGKPAPLMVNNEVYRATTREIDIRRKVDEVQREDLRQKRDADKKEQEEIQRRHQDLMRDVNEDKKEAVDDLELFVQLKTKLAHARFTKDELIKRLKDYDEHIARAEKEVKDMSEIHPDFESQYMERYIKALEAAGIRPDSAPLIKYMK